MPAKKSDAPQGIIRKQFKNFLRWANILLIVLTLLVYTAPYISPASFWPLSLIAPLYPLTLFLNVVFAIWWMLWRKWYALLSLLCIFIGWQHLQNHFGFHFFAQAGPSDLQIISFNIHDLYDLPLKDSKRGGRDLTSLLNFLDEIGNPPIICLQEIHENPARELADAIGYKHVHYPQKGTAILTRVPLLDYGLIPLKSSGNSAIWADIKWGNKRLRIFNLHLQSNRVSAETEHLSQQSELDKKALQKLKDILKKYRRAARIRIEQVAQVRQQTAQSPYPFIICGDFNDTPLSYTYHYLSKGLSDAFRQKGQGSGATYARFPPALRIDYILASPELQPSLCHVAKVQLSDHYPVIAFWQVPD